MYACTDHFAMIILYISNYIRQTNTRIIFYLLNSPFLNNERTFTDLCFIYSYVSHTHTCARVHFSASFLHILEVYYVYEHHGYEVSRIHNTWIGQVTQAVYTEFPWSMTSCRRRGVIYITTGCSITPISEMIAQVIYERSGLWL